MLSMKLAVSPTLDRPIILLKSPTILENFSLIKAQCDGLHLSYDPNDCVENYTHVIVGHEQHDVCDSYILDVVLLKITLREESLVVETFMLQKHLSSC